MKKILAFILSIMLIVNVSVPVYADVPETYQKTKDFLWQIVQDVGFIGSLPAKGLTYIVNEILHSKGITGEDVETEEEALDFAFDGISINGNGNVVLNDDAKQFINYWINDYKTDNQYYVGYSLDLSRYSKTYWWVSDLENILTEYGDNYYILAGADGGRYSNWWYYLFDKTKFAPVWRSNVGSGLTARYAFDFYNTTTFDRTAPDGGCYYFKKPANGSIGSMTQTTPQSIYSNNINFQAFVNSYQFVSSEFEIPLQNNYLFVTNGSIEPITIYGSQNLLATYGRGYAPYYYNNDVYNDFSSSTGDYTLTNDNRNYVTYGDVNTYIDDHHTETGNYPSIPEINIWIEEQPIPTPNPTPNPDNPSGDGSSGSFINNNSPVFNNNPNINIHFLPTVSGNGNGSEGGIGSLFGWLGDLGQVIGDLIKNLGEAIKNIVEGISDLITSIVNDLPTMFFDFIGAFFGWLPPEWSTLLSLSLASMLIFGIIKIFRG